MAYSLVAEAVMQQQGQKFESGKQAGTEARQPVRKGESRGSLGSLGARMFKSRNVSAGENKEREQILSMLTGGPVPTKFTSRRIRAIQSAKLGRVV